MTVLGCFKYALGFPLPDVFIPGTLHYDRQQFVAWKAVSLTFAALKQE